MKTIYRARLIVFVIAAVVTFGCITLLQYTPAPWFFLVLIAMHGGIVLFIVSKRSFRKAGFAVARFYRIQYILLVPYLLIMLSVFASKAGLIAFGGEAKTLTVLVYSAFCVIVTAWNTSRLSESLEQQCAGIENDAHDAFLHSQNCQDSQESQGS